MASAVILAGGQSRRMRADKLQLPVHGVSMLDRVIDVVGHIADDVIVVGQDVPGVVSIPDQKPGLGPLGGLVTGLQAARDSVALVVAADLPFLNVDVLRFLLAALSDYDAAVPRVGGRVQPLHAVYRTTVDVPAARLLATGERRLGGLLEKLRVRWIEAPEIAHVDPALRSFVNINTREEWLEAQRSMA